LGHEKSVRGGLADIERQHEKKRKRITNNKEGRREKDGGGGGKNADGNKRPICG